MRVVVVVNFFFFLSIYANPYQECKIAAFETFSTGMPVAFSTLVFWAFLNRIPHNWKTVDENVAEFIYTTWEQQGFSKARSVVLKKIPKDSFLFNIIVFTQDLPGALALGEPFVEKLKLLLEERKHLLQQKALGDIHKESILRNRLEDVEKSLDIFRFMCGHERVHKQLHHIYKLLFIQCCAPFVVYGSCKLLKYALEKVTNRQCNASFVLNAMTRSCLELLVGFIYARKFEYDADRLASCHRHVQEAGLQLFVQSKKQQENVAQKPLKKLEKIIGWALYYTHPTLQERIILLTRMLKKS